MQELNHLADFSERKQVPVVLAVQFARLCSTASLYNQFCLSILLNDSVNRNVLQICLKPFAKRLQNQSVNA